MNIVKIFNTAMVAAALSPLFLLEGCTCNNIDPQSLMTKGARSSSIFAADAPQAVHQLSDLTTSWVWTTTQGDAATDFQISLEQVSDNVVRLVNFHNLDGTTIEATVDGNSISFEGPIMDGDLEVRNGKGTLTNGWLTIDISYDLFDGVETESFAAQLNKGHTL